MFLSLPELSELVPGCHLLDLSAFYPVLRIKTGLEVPHEVPLTLRDFPSLFPSIACYVYFYYLSGR